MTTMEAIDRRISRRTYTGALPPHDADVLEAMMESLNQKHGLTFRLVRNDAALFGGFLINYGMFTGVRSLFLAAGPEGDPHLRERVGHAGQQLVLEATKRDLGTCWVGATFDRKKIARYIGAGREVACVIPVGPVSDPRGMKERLVWRMNHLTGDSLIWRSMGTPPPWFLPGVRAAALAPSANNRLPARFLYTGSGVMVKVPDDTPLQRIDLGIAKLHFELGAGGRFPLGNPAKFRQNTDLD